MAPFVFPPGVFLLSFPMGLLPEAGARLYWSAIGAVTVPLLALALWQIARVTAVDGPARLLRACWVTLGVSIGGTAGALYVGQPSVLVALGICLVHLGLRDSRAAIFLTGAALCSLKPHLSLIWVVAALLMPPARLARAKGLLAGFVLLAAAALTLADPQVFSDYLHALKVLAGLSRAELLYGLPGLLDWGRSHPRGIAILAVALVTSAAAGRALARRRPAQCDWSIPMLAGACLAEAFVSAHKGYDFSVYALVLALAARLPRTVQTLLLVPALLDLLPVVRGAANHVVLLDAVLACSAGFLILYGLGQRARSQQSRAAAPVVPRI
ncbi:glycosyltransferase 87 family protein [Rhodovulum sulfidophilum]|uniref:glycosyltransferase 87 family protein n=1 Tax=Rhodovulum sulfidophilum TaxID=35806 RepID=UPI003075C7C3